jgi:hypothetical protein
MQLVKTQRRGMHALRQGLHPVPCIKHITIVNDDSSVVDKFGASLTDNA